jgi:hypothetical protein
LSSEAETLEAIVEAVIQRLQQLEKSLVDMAQSMQFGFRELRDASTSSGLWQAGAAPRFAMIEKEITEMKVSHSRELDEMRREQLEIGKVQLRHANYIEQQRGGMKGISNTLLVIFQVLTLLVALLTCWAIYHKPGA